MAKYVLVLHVFSVPCAVTPELFNVLSVSFEFSWTQNPSRPSNGIITLPHLPVVDPAATLSRQELDRRSCHTSLRRLIHVGTLEVGHNQAQEGGDGRAPRQDFHQGHSRIDDRYPHWGSRSGDQSAPAHRYPDREGREYAQRQHRARHPEGCRHP